MQQYFVNKELYEENFEEGNIKEEPHFSKDKYTDVIFASYRWDSKGNIHDIVFDNCTFSKLGLRKSKFNHVNMAHSVFISCYFREASFSCCDFTGAIFIECNFDETVFTNCVFQYAEFKNCFIPYAAMKNNLPRQRHNLTRDLCRNLGLEALHIGDDVNFRLYFFEEKRANEKYYHKKFYHSQTEDGGYYQKYNIWDACSGLFHFFMSKLNKYLWGYGENLKRLMANMIITVMAYWAVYQKMDISIGSAKRAWYDGLYISLSNFFTMSLIPNYSFPHPTAYEIASVTEAGLGVMMMGFFVAAVFRYINRRS